METLIKLTVRTPNNRFEDLKVNCDVCWTVKKLKEYLQDVYPSKPATSSQKLIYCGKLLQDHLLLGEVFARSSTSEDEEEIVRTLHIVCAECSTDGSPPNASSSQESPTASTEEGLRRRRTNEQTVQNATGSPTTPSSPVATPIMSQFSQPSSPQIMSHFSQPASPPIMSQFSQPASPLAAFYQQLSPSSPGAGAFLFPPTSLQQQQMQMQAAYIQQWQQHQQQQQQQQASATNPTAAHAEWWRYYQQHMSAHLPMTPPPSATPHSIAATLPARTQAPAAHNLPPPAPAPAVVGAPAAIAAAQNQNARLNAGPGGAMGLADDDEENEGVPRDRDWLDYVYLLLRAVLTLGIVFFYSTTTRFALVCLLGFIVYLYQAGYFTPRPAVQLPAVQLPANQQPANHPVEGVVVGGEEQAANGEHSTDQTNETPPVEPARPSSIRIICTFVVSFFSSLVPHGVPPIQAN